MPILAALAVLFALTITDISPETINSPDDVVTINASASGLQNSLQYLEVGITKEVAGNADYFGWTKNLKDEWYQYKSGPATSDLSSYFYSFLPQSGTWSGQLQAKIDTGDSGFKGPGSYFLKLFKFITTSASYSNVVGLTINVAQPTVASSPANAPAPVVDWTVGGRYELGEIFGAEVKLLNFDPDSQYYLKLRGGLDENTMNKVQTENALAYFADTENWNKFPLIKTDKDGNWSGQIRGQVSEDKPEGGYKIRIRAHKKDADTSIDSGVREVKFIRPELLPIQEEEASPAAFASDEAELLGTESAAFLDIFSPEASAPAESSSPVKVKQDLVLVFAGLASLGLSAVLLYNRLP